MLETEVVYRGDSFTVPSNYGGDGTGLTLKAEMRDRHGNATAVPIQWTDQTAGAFEMALSATITQALDIGAVQTLRVRVIDGTDVLTQEVLTIEGRD